MGDINDIIGAIHLRPIIQTLLLLCALFQVCSTIAKREAANQSTFFTQNAKHHFKVLVIVPVNGLFKGSAYEDILNNQQWLLPLSSKELNSEIPSIVLQIKKGLSIASENEHALLVFSGVTKSGIPHRFTSNKHASGAEGYKRVAQLLLFKKEPVANENQKSKASQIMNRIAIDTQAQNAFQKILYSMCAFMSLNDSKCDFSLSIKSKLCIFFFFGFF